MSGADEKRSWRDKTQQGRDLEAIATQESLLADYEEMVIDSPSQAKLVTRVYGRIEELKKGLRILKQRTGAAK